ncbi:MAG: antitoxin Xre/MbcA/ParS toxin-binding domain-containing protein [Blastocatellia bacterium]
MKPRRKASLWLQEPNRALGLQTPLSLLDTDEGARRVEDVLIRIEHGVFSCRSEIPYPSDLIRD